MSTQQESELRVRVVGWLTVCRAGRTLPSGEVGSRKARTVLAVLAVHGGFVSVDRITGAVWGDAPPRDPAANLATLVSRLRAGLGPHVIVGGRGGYRLGDLVRVDLSEITELVAQAEERISAGQPTAALMTARRALHELEQGVVLIDHSDDVSWVTPARTRHDDLLRRARHTVAEAALHIRDNRAASAAAEAAFDADPFDEIACRLLMRAHHAAGEQAKATLVYHRLRAVLATELGIDPAPATRTLHHAILRDAADATQAAAPHVSGAVSVR